MPGAAFQGDCDLSELFPSPALAVRGLVKTFNRPAVDGLDLTIQRGEFYALLGDR